MEPRFKADFSAVRVHNDSHAHDWAPAVNARAFIVGRYVYAANQIDRTAGARVHVHRLAGQ
jgi:hypothetical protein